ncbi:MAG: RNA-binding S4 domain-containing protein [Solirubrobacteraceae bacterium]
MERAITITGDMIRLGQLLKLAGMSPAGADAKALIAGGRVCVNDEPEVRRGRQLHPGDLVRVGDESLRVVGGVGISTGA